MKTEPSKGFVRILATEFVPVTISVVSLLLSTFNLYVNYLKTPDISFVVAPYINHVVDSRSGNEAFFIPVTMINRGARPGTVLSFELTVTRVSDKSQADYFAQYFGQQNDAAAVGQFFTPLSLNGYSSDSRTVCFYPAGARSGRLFSGASDYVFVVSAVTANVSASSRKATKQTFVVHLTDQMTTVMAAQPNGEYPFPIPVESNAAP